MRVTRAEPMQPHQTLSAQRRALWESDGYLILPGFFSPSQLAELDAVTDWVWREKPSAVTVDDTQTGERMQMSALGRHRPRNRYKVNDLYLVSQTVRQTVLDPRIVPLLSELLRDEPVLCNTLTIDVGTTQDPHLDTLFMTPSSDDALVATWTALEDVGPERGPIFYYPGSHRLPPFRFSNGSQHVVDEEMDDWRRAIMGGLAERGIERHVFLPRAGDVFIWHARLVHGGMPISDLAGTRKSLVAHFFTRTDCARAGLPLMPTGAGAWWFNRDPQKAPIAGRVPSSNSAADGWPRAHATERGAIDELTTTPGQHSYAGSQVATIKSGDQVCVRGWAFDRISGQPFRELAARLDGGLIHATPGAVRPDVALALGEPHAAESEFLIRFGTRSLRRGTHTVAIDGRREDGTVVRIGECRIRVS